MNFLVPNGTATGAATVHIGGVNGTVTVSNVAPGLFSMGASTTAAEGAIRVPNGQITQTVVPVFDCGSGTCNTVPIAIGNQSTVYVSLYGTGLRGAAPSVTCTVGGVAGDAARSYGVSGVIGRTILAGRAGGSP